MRRTHIFVALALALGAVSAEGQKKKRPKKAPVAVVAPTPPGLTTGAHDVVLNDVRFWYRVAGVAEKGVPPVVFLHGGPGYSSYSFAALAGPRLERSLQMIYFDQRGAGRSERPWTGHYQLDTLVQDVEALRRALGIDRIAVMGHAFGGLLALEYAARYPEHVSRLVLVGAFSDGPATCLVHRERLAGMHLVEYLRAIRDSAWLKAARRSDCDLEGRALSSAEHERFNDSGMFAAVASKRAQDSVDAASGLRNTGEMSRALFGAGLFDYRFRRFNDITAPALVLAGAHDNAVGVVPQRMLATKLMSGRLALYDKAGHFPYLDEPERFARDVISFMKADLEP